MKFKARVVDGQHNMRSLILDADNEEHVRRQLHQLDCRALSVVPAARASLVPFRSRPFPVMLFAQELHALLEAGLSVIEAIEVLIEKESQPQSRAVLQRLQSSLRDGSRLSAALRSNPASFPTLLIGMVQASERTGGLPEALGRFVEYSQRLDMIRSRLISAAIYPIILGVAGMAVGLLLLGYVVPRFASVYRSSGRELPWASELLLGWGRLVHDHAATVAWISAVLLTLGLWWLLRFGGVAVLARALHRLPWVGSRLHVLQVSRLCLTLGLLLEAGVSIIQALQMCGSVLSPAGRHALERAAVSVSEGSPLSEALSAQGLATPISSRLVRVGETSGQLGTMLRRAANFHEGETSRWLERFSKAFEPVLMAIIGVVIGGIVVLLYMPILDLAGSVQ